MGGGGKLKFAILSFTRVLQLQGGAMVKNDGEEGGEIAQPHARHIKKRALRNKALSVSFNEKDLRFSFELSMKLINGLIWTFV